MIMNFLWICTGIFGLWFCCCIVNKSVCICESCWFIWIVCCSRSVLLICNCLWYKMINSWCWRFNVCMRWLLFNDCSCCCSWRVCRKACSNKRYSLVGFGNRELDGGWWHSQVHDGDWVLDVDTKQIFYNDWKAGINLKKYQWWISIKVENELYLQFRQYHHQLVIAKELKIVDYFPSILLHLNFSLHRPFVHH